MAFKDKIAKYLKYLILVLGIIFMLSLVRGVFSVIRAGRKVEEVRARVAALKVENEELTKNLEKAKSSQNIEKELRDKLGLSKEGETVIVLPDEETLQKYAPPPRRGKKILFRILLGKSGLNSSIKKKTPKKSV